MPSRGKRWVELSVEVDRASVDDIVAFMERHCQGGVAVEDRSFIDERAAEGWEEATPSMPDKGGPVWVKGFLPIDDRETLQKLEIALLLLGQVSPISAPHTRILEPEEWAESWKAFFPPQRIGRHIVIVPTWREYEAQAGDIIIRLDPGMAFGTGLHPTTRLCLLALEHILSAQGAKGALTWRVLDV
ncbi:MAG: 50S ribosomal protein L11 methyltransferase, partial [Chloroflexi bacterium]|nr:50S ribosomal protein L11 methyltransferase [Chloroflexota bacterium]